MSVGGRKEAAVATEADGGGEQQAKSRRFLKTLFLVLTPMLPPCPGLCQ